MENKINWQNKKSKKNKKIKIKNLVNFKKKV